MKTGIVVNNYDPTFNGRCQIRVDGIHTQSINGLYIILDDDLPWAVPGPNPTSTGLCSVPKVGDRVYVDIKDTYNLVYYGPVEIKGTVKEIFHDNAESSEKVKVIACSDDYNKDGSKEYMRIYYHPENGLVIECNGNLITLPKYDLMEIKTKGGAGFSINTESNDITIHTNSKVTLDCKEVKLTADAEDKLILGSKLMETFNNHTHFTSDGQSSKPIKHITPGDFSKKIKIG